MKTSLLFADILFTAMSKLNGIAELPVSVKIGLKLNMKRLQNDVQSYHEVRDELIMKYGEKDENGRMGISPESLQWEAFQKEFIPLNQQEITCDLVHLSYTYTELLELLLKCGSLDNSGLSSAELEVLEFICKKEE